MSAKIEREKYLHFQFKSDMVDVGTYARTFVIKRKTPKLDTQYVVTKSLLSQGTVPTTKADLQLLDTIATLSVYFTPIDKNGKAASDEEWIDDILDPNILWALHKEWIEYQNSFYPKAETQDETAVQG